ncbi:MAG: hypothetical protein DCC49_05870 [Acidobacteria bacterium]|nr:MAG: hypothetical protein DCC49_05870 [Acidobacteriota bacterium]
MQNPTGPVKVITPVRLLPPAVKFSESKQAFLTEIREWSARRFGVGIAPHFSSQDRFPRKARLSFDRSS